jgi:hypothetical protein
MRIIFYTVACFGCEGDCNYKICSRRYYSRLVAKVETGDFYPVEGEISSDSLCMEPIPRHGDIVILYVKGRKDLLAMNKSCERLEGMKKVLVVGDAFGIDSSMFHTLYPRYITQASRTIEELMLVLRNMKIRTNVSLGGEYNVT